MIDGIEGIKWIRQSDNTLMLYVKQNGHFVKYNVSSIAQPDHDVRNGFNVSIGSKGFATAQYAIKQGVKYIE